MSPTVRIVVARFGGTGVSRYLSVLADSQHPEHGSGVCVGDVGRVREHCNMLMQARLIEPFSPEFQNYDITGAGRRYLDGRLDASDQPEPSPKFSHQS